MAIREVNNVIEVNDWRDLPWGSVLVRRKGRAVAAYTWQAEAEAHAAPLEDATIWPDNCIGIAIPKAWEIDHTTQRLARTAVEALATEWLDRQKTIDQ